MPTQVGMINPLRVNNPPGAVGDSTFPRFVEVFALDPAITQTTINALVPVSGQTPTAVGVTPAGVGTLVQLQGWNGAASAAAAAPAYPTLAIATTTQNFLVLGVVLGPSTNAGAAVLANPGTGAGSNAGLVQVITEGLCFALFDGSANPAVGNAAIQSTATAGTLAASATATLGKTAGVVLAAATIAGSTIGGTIIYFKRS